jgi:hypothetical protein
MYITCTTRVQHLSHMGWAPHTVGPIPCERDVVHLLCMWCTRITFHDENTHNAQQWYNTKVHWGHQYNNCTTTLHMRVGPSMWDPPSCEELLYRCCIGVVNLTFFLTLTCIAVVSLLCTKSARITLRYYILYFFHI